MNVYKVMLVDDEENVARAILKKIEWEAIGFEVPKYARNGIEALELAESLKPDVVMTDIKMPYMDGMELARNLRKLYPNIRIIFFSGFDEFEYAKEAIRLEAEEYILKPIDSNELKNIFEKVHGQLDKETEERLSTAKLEKYYTESLPLLQEDFLTALIEGRIPGEKVDKLIEDYRIDLPGPYYVCAIVHTSSNNVPEGMNPLLLKIAVKRLIEERIDDRWKVRTLPYAENTVMIACLSDEKKIASFTDECDRLCRLSESILKAGVTIGIGNVCKNMEEISKSYSGGRDAVSYRALYGSCKAINIEEIVPQEDDDYYGDNSEGLYDIFKKVKMSDEAAIRLSIEEYMKKTSDKHSSIQNYRFYVMELVSDIYKFAKNNQLDTTEIFDKDEDLYSKLRIMEAGELSKWLEQVCIRMHVMIGSKRNDSTRSFVAKAKDYVTEHYADQELTVDYICNHLGVSSAYFSTIFKKETGTTFVTYLTDYRMDRAKHLLVETDDKTYIIAEKVGYSDPNYFSYVFKKQFGVSPSKFKGV